jgi:uncharacterized protein with HEPN domain
VSRDRLYASHILECVQRAERYAEAGRQAFLGDPMRQDALVRVLQILAESTQRLSSEVKGQHPEIDWRRLSGFRNILVHDYLGVDLDAVWLVVTTRLPALGEAMERILSELS